MSKNIARSLSPAIDEISSALERGEDKESKFTVDALQGKRRVVHGNARVKYLTIRSMNFNRRQGIITQLVRSLNIPFFPLLSKRFFSPPVASSFSCLLFGFLFSKKTMISRNLYFCREEEEEFIETIINLDNNTTFIYLHR